jgi:hypothetical protein
MKIKTTLAVLATLALLAACVAPPQGTVQVEVLNADEFGLSGPAGATDRGSLLCATEDGNCVESWNGSDIVVYSDQGSTEKFSVDGATGNVVLAGGLTVTGGVTGTNVLTTGDQTVAGVKTFSTAVAVGALTGPVTLTGPTAVATATPAVVVNNLGAANNSFEVRDAATPVFVIGQAGVGSITGALTMSGGYTANNAGYVNAPTAVATATPAFMVNSAGVSNLFEVRDSATPVFQVRDGGAVAAQSIYSLAPVLVKDADYAVLTTDTGAIIKNTALVSATFTLPGAVAGLNYCVYNYAGTDVIIEFTDATDVALNEVNSPGDSVTNTTAFDNICLAAIDDTNWVTLSSVGTWADGN